jgi:hypothetical protein
MKSRRLRKSTATTNQLSDRQHTRIVYITHSQTIQIHEKQFQATEVIPQWPVHRHYPTTGKMKINLKKDNKQE